MPILLTAVLFLLAPPGPAPEVPKGLRCLAAAYPDHVARVTPEKLIFTDGTEMAWDDGKKKPDFMTRLNNADLEDQMSQAYTPGLRYEIPPINHDPGRIRYDPFFKKMYGKTRKEAASKMTTIRWMPKTVNRKLRVTTVNDVHKRLEAVGRELDELPPKLKRYVKETSGTFVWRKIKGTNRMSMHSYGVAIDVGVKFSNYWKWTRRKKGQPIKYVNRIPAEIAVIFEKHGFIWGAKWYHYDTMHFEYRPELLHPLCAGSPPAEPDPE